MTGWRHARRLHPRPRRADTMGMPHAARRYTAEEVLGFPSDGNRYEVVGGELLVTPSPTQKHQLVLGRLYVALRSEEHTSELQSPCNLVCRLLLEKKKSDERALLALLGAQASTTTTARSRRRTHLS